MSMYLTEAELTREACQAMISNPENRADALGKAYQSLGGELHGYFFVVGSTKIFILGDLPDDVSVEAATLTVMAGGAATSIRIHRLMSAADAVQAMQKAKDVTYTPPKA
jgi:uncharacterized protein with GYD domain